MGRAEQQHLDWLARSLGRPDYAPLTEADIEVIRQVGEVVSMRSGSTLISEGGHPTVILVVEQGEIELCRGPVGKRRVVARAGPGSVLGDVSAFGDRPYGFTARAVGPVRVLHLDRTRLLGELAGHPGLLLRWLVSGHRQLERSHRRVIELMHKTVLAQVADVLAEESQARDEVNLSQATIANLLGVSRQSVNEALGRLRDQGLVSTGYRSIKILDPEALQRIAET
jgi:CRP-like cAMP-binding protein